MKLIEYKCPSCGGSLKIDKDAKSVKCSYCGTTSEIEENVLKIKIVDEEQENFDLIKTLIDDNRYEPATDRLFKLSIKDPTDSRVWKNMILIITDKMNDLDPSKELKEYYIGTRNEKITLEQAIELYKKYETDKEEKSDFLDECYMLIERYNYNRYKLEQSIKEKIVIEEETQPKDVLYDEILEYAARLGQISASIIQRKYSIGYNRAARIIDSFEERGIVGPAKGSKPREVLIKPEDIEYLK